MTQFDDVDQLVQGSESTDPNVGKYFKVEVPNYANTAGPDGKVSYLRVGAARTDWQNEPGADLIGLAYLVGTAGNKYGTTLAEGPNVVTALQKLYGDDTPNVTELADPFVDDQRTRGRDAEAGNDDSEDRPNRAPGHGMSAAQRRARSANLHRDTGWREHTDGNRISTTRGDRIDVVYGNYKMVVMGRQSQPGDAMAWDVSGNHIQDFGGGTMPGASVTLEWVNTTYAEGATGGAWLLQNSTERVYQYSRNAGNFREQHWGDLHENYVGSENPKKMGTVEGDGMQGHPTKRDQYLGGTADAPVGTCIDQPRGNPVMVERTWATKIDAWTGSAAWWVPDVVEKEWVTKKTSESHITTLDETTHVGNHTSTTQAEHIIEYTSSRAHVALSASIIDVEMYSGLKVSVEFAGSLSLAAPVALSATFGYDGSFCNLKDDMAILENNLKVTKNDVMLTASAAMNTKAEVVNMKSELAATKNELATTKTELAASSKSIATQQTQVNTLYNVLSGAVMLG